MGHPSSKAMLIYQRASPVSSINRWFNHYQQLVYPLWTISVNHGFSPLAPWIFTENPCAPLWLMPLWARWAPPPPRRSAGPRTRRAAPGPGGQSVARRGRACPRRVRNCEKNHGGKGKDMENHAKTIENLGKIIEKSEENHGNVRGKTSKIIFCEYVAIT